MDHGPFNLVKYDAARKALAEAHRVDEAKDIRDKALAIEAYARQAKDNALIIMAREIKLRAERRCGELLREMKATGQRQIKGGKGTGGAMQTSSRSPSTTRTLAELGITKDQSSDWQKLADLPADQFEHRIVQTRERPGRSPRVSMKPHGTPKPKATTTTDQCQTCRGPLVRVKHKTPYCPACRQRGGVLAQAKARAEREAVAKAARVAHLAALPRWAERLIDGTNDDQLIHQLIVEEWIIMTHIAGLIKAQHDEREAHASLQSSALQLQGKYGGVVQIKDTLKLLDCLTRLGTDLRDRKDIGNPLKKPWIAANWLGSRSADPAMPEPPHRQ